MIYKRVLGGKIIHAHDATELDHSNCKRPYCRSRFDVCEIPTDFSTDAFEIETYMGNKEPREWPIYDHYEKCDSPVDLGLLYVCRQIYKESLFVLFQTSTFTRQDCEDGDSLDFLQELSPSQSARLTSLSLTSMNSFPVVSEEATARLTGLKSLEIGLDVTTGGSTLEVLRELEKSFEDSGMESFQRLNIKSVRINMKMLAERAYIEDVRQGQEKVISWLKLMEKRIMQSIEARSESSLIGEHR